MKYLVLWWAQGRPYAALFTSPLVAEIAAKARNAVMVAFNGDDSPPELWDWYRRDDADNPMPFEWRDLPDQVVPI